MNTPFKPQPACTIDNTVHRGQSYGFCFGTIHTKILKEMQDYMSFSTFYA